MNTSVGVMNTCLLGHAPVIDCTLADMHTSNASIYVPCLCLFDFWHQVLWCLPLIFSYLQQQWVIISIHMYKNITEFLIIYIQCKTESESESCFVWISEFHLFTISLFTTLTWMFLEISLDQVVHYVVLVNSIHCHSALKIKPRDHLVHLRYVICQNNWVLHQKVIRDLGTYRGALWGSLHPVRVTACTECMHTGL